MNFNLPDIVNLCFDFVTTKYIRVLISLPFFLTVVSVCIIPFGLAAGCCSAGGSGDY